MLTYTNRLPKLILPEYGRNIQSMINHCLAIENRDERNACANTIITAMNALFPANGGDKQEHVRKLWDHLLIMSDFRLDVDMPFEHVAGEVFAEKPDHIDIPYPNRVPKYGVTTLRMIERACAIPPGDERDELVYLIADHMKKTIVAFNREQIDDVRVFNDLRMLSHGEINLSPETCRLHEFRALPAPSKKKKRK